MKRLALLFGILVLGASSGCNKHENRSKPDTTSSASAVTGTRPAASKEASGETGWGETGWGEPGGDFQKGAPFTMLMHADTPLRLVKGKRIDVESDAHLSLPRARKGQVSAFAAVLFVDSKFHEHGAAAYCARATKKIDNVLAQHAGTLRPGLTVQDFQRNWTTGHFTWFRTLEGSWCLQGNVDTIDALYDDGIRMIGLTWKDDNDFAASWNDNGRVGLTERGKKAVERMNRLGIAVDVSHMSDRAIDDVLAIAKAPVFATHSNARALCDHPRNLKDEHIRKIAATGGVVGANFYPMHLRKNGKATVADVVAHIEHIRDVGGIGSVGLGSDFDGIHEGPKGLETASQMPKLREALKAQGFSDEDVAAIFGGNFLRAFGAVERRARELSGR